MPLCYQAAIHSTLHGSGHTVYYQSRHALRVVCVCVCVSATLFYMVVETGSATISASQSVWCVCVCICISAKLPYMVVETSSAAIFASHCVWFVCVCVCYNMRIWGHCSSAAPRTHKLHRYVSAKHSGRSSNVSPSCTTSRSWCVCKRSRRQLGW